MASVEMTGSVVGVGWSRCRRSGLVDSGGGLAGFYFLEEPDGSDAEDGEEGEPAEDVDEGPVGGLLG